MKKCPYCGAEYYDGATQCPSCRKTLEETVSPLYDAPEGASGGRAGFAVTSLVLGIIAVICNCGLYGFALPCGIISIVLAAVAMKRNYAGRGMAVAGLVLGIIAISLGILALIMGGAMFLTLKNFFGDMSSVTVSIQ